MAVLPDSGTTSYNGVSFVTVWHSNVSTRPVKDEAERTTIAVEHVIHVEGIVQGNSGTGTTLGSMRKLLTQPAGALVYNGRGFGTLEVNGLSGGVLDAKWGPWPEVLEFVPLGGGNAARVRFTVKTWIPECDAARYKQAIMAVNYEISYDIDQDGYTTVDWRGYLEIPMTRARQSSRNIPDTADKYREDIRPFIPLGFKRTNVGGFRLSKDKRRLDWSFRDEQIPAAYPDFVTNIQARHSISTDIPGGFTTVCNASFDITVTLAAGRPKTDALAVFQMIVRARLGPDRHWLPMRFNFNDDVFGRTASFSAVFRGSLLGPNKDGVPPKVPRAILDAIDQGRNLTPVGEMLLVSKIWTPIPGTDFQDWQSSLDTCAATHVRGQYGLKHTPNMDVIVDLCEPHELPVKRKPPTIGGPIGSSKDPPPKPDGPGNGVILPINPWNAWLFWLMKVRLVEDQNVIKHKPVGEVKRIGRDGQDKVAPGPGIKLGSGFTTMGTTLATTAGGATGAPGGVFRTIPMEPIDFYQRGRAATRAVELSGVGVRVGYRVPCPELRTIGGAVAVELGRDVSESVVGSIFGYPVYRTTWSIWYDFNEAVPALPVTPNPNLGLPGQASGGFQTLTTTVAVQGSK